MKKSVIVVGPMRSGTSMVAGILSKIGVDMGEDAWHKSRANPTGYFEDVDFFQLNEAILEAAGGDRRDPPSRKDILRKKELFNERVKELIDSKEKELWGWKDPRNVLTIDIYIEHIDNPYIIICSRELDSIILSYSTMTGLSYKDSESIINEYIDRLRNLIIRLEEYKVMELQYESVVNDPVERVDNIISFLGIEVSETDRRKAYSHVKKREYLRLLKIKRLIEKGIRKPTRIPGYIIKRVRHLIN